MVSYDLQVKTWHSWLTFSFQQQSPRAPAYELERKVKHIFVPHFATIDKFKSFMILLNAFYKGLTGALSALLCYLLYVLFRYDKSLLKSFFYFIKSKGNDSFTLSHFVLMLLINSPFIWLITFGLMSAIFDWRVMSSEDCAATAIIFPVTVCLICFYFYRKYNSSSTSSTKNIISFFKRINHNKKHVIPNTKNDVVKFNYYFSFSYIPSKFKLFTDNHIKFSDIWNFSDFNPEYIKYREQIEAVESGLNNDPNIRMALITDIPTSKAISEVVMLLIIHDKSRQYSRLYSLEFSFDDYCVCDITSPSTRDNLGFTDDGDKFLAICLGNFNSHLSALNSSYTRNSEKEKECIPSNNLSHANPIKEKLTSENRYTREQIVLRPSTPTTDIYGTPLANRLKDIFDCIQSSADWMTKQLIELPTLSIQGRMEAEIITASILANHIEIDLVVQSLLIGNPLYHNIGITCLMSKIKDYISLYNSDVKRDFVIESKPLLAFAAEEKKIYGAESKLKIAEFKQADKFGNYKLPVFIRPSETHLLCHFDWNDPDKHTPQYISSNKNNIIVERWRNGDYVFITNDEITRSYDSYFDRMAFYLFIEPLKYHASLSSYEIIIGLETNKITFSSQNSIVGYAYSEGKRVTEVGAASIGLIGSINTAIEDELP